MNEDAYSSLLLLYGDRVVEVLGRLRVDGEGEEIAQVDPIFERGRWTLVGLEATPAPALDQQSFEHDLDPRGPSEHPLDPRALAARLHYDEIAQLDFRARPLLEE